MLEIGGLRKSFGGRCVLEGLDLTVAAGEAVALLGGNGCGKTTTLRCIAGLILPDAGRIEIAGCDALRRGPEARRRLSYMPQRSAFPPTLRVREAIGVAARLRDVSAARVEAEIVACGLEAAAESAVSALSGGQRQRLALAIAFLPEVPLYLFDEPSANLDEPALEVFRRRALCLAQDGHAVLFTTHSREDVETLASRAVRLAGGRRVEEEAARRAGIEREERCAARRGTDGWSAGLALVVQGPWPRPEADSAGAARAR